MLVQRLVTIAKNVDQLLPMLEAIVDVRNEKADKRKLKLAQELPVGCGWYGKAEKG
jgi:hypothetical protein